MDDMTPTVWEEADGAGLSATINQVSGSAAGATIEVTPSGVPDGLAAVFAWSPDADGGSSTSDKGVGGSTAGHAGSGWDLTLTATEDLHGVAGLTLYGGISEVDQNTGAANVNGNRDEDVLGIKYAMGSFTAGYQQSKEKTGMTGTASYDNISYGITFSINDDLSVGYGHKESDQSGSSADAEANSFQASYTMGGATFRIADVDVENGAYAAATDQTATIVSLGLAF
jgi:outer membrane protein OmpU